MSPNTQLPEKYLIDVSALTTIYWKDTDGNWKAMSLSAGLDGVPFNPPMTNNFRQKLETAWCDLIAANVESLDLD